MCTQFIHFFVGKNKDEDKFKMQYHYWIYFQELKISILRPQHIRNKDGSDGKDSWAFYS